MLLSTLDLNLLIICSIEWLLLSIVFQNFGLTEIMVMRVHFYLHEVKKIFTCFVQLQQAALYPGFDL